MKEVTAQEDFQATSQRSFFDMAYQFDIPQTMLKDLEQCFHSGRTRDEALECQAKLRRVLHQEKRASIKPHKTPFSKDSREPVTKFVNELSNPTH